jgi:hypothetical protein
MLSTQQSEFPSSLNDTLQDIDHVQAAPAYVLLLNLISHKNKYQIIDSDLENITKLLVSFFVRRNITDTPPTRALTRLFMKIIDRIEDQTGPNIRRIILEELKSVSADDDTFRSKLEGPIYEENSGITRFVLCYLAERGMTNEYDSDLWKKDGKQYVWTIEHIFPQGENIPDEWVQMIADGDRNLAVSRQRQYVHTLGNLTITGYNSALGNKSFEEKRDRTDRNGNPVGFNNKLNLNAELASSTSWTVEQIKNRTSNLTNKIMAEFNLMNV